MRPGAAQTGRGSKIEAQPETANVATRMPAAAPDFLAGGGEAGERIRAVDWSATPLGAPETWPQSLKTIVRVLLDSRYAMWMLWGPELTFFCNDAYLPTVGIKRDWVIGARSDRVWEEIWPDIGPRIARVLEHGQATWDEGLLLFLERSGFSEETYHTFSYSPVYDDHSRIAGMLCVVTEVTERVISERRLRALRDLAGRSRGIDSVVETCERACEVLATYPLDVPFAALYLMDETGDRRARIVASTRDAESTALSPALEIDDPPSWLAKLAETERLVELDDLGPRGLGVTAEPLPDLVRKAFAVPLKGARQQGLAGFLVAGLSPRRPLDEAYESFVSLVGKQIDSAIGEAQAYEAERRRAEALAELDRAKTTFFSNVSHEFRTPLTLMLGPLEAAVAAADTPPKLREALALAHRNAGRLQKLVNSLLDFSRIEAGRVRASYEPTDLCALTRDLASNFRSAMERAGLEFAVDCEELDEPLFVDREMWEKIVLNLLSNALKFTLEGRVSVSVARDGGCAVLRVADTGVGMPKHELPHLFERFYRIEGVEGRTHEGTGIGLALVQELVRLHGGTIDAESELARGTEFRVRIPFGSAHLPPERVRRQRWSAPSGSAAQAFVQEALRWLHDDDTAAGALESSTPAERDDRFAKTFGARIVLADDNADMRSYVTALLAPYYSVEAVADGEAALAATRRARPDLVVTDVMMPRLDGFELLAAIRADDGLRSLPVVLLSARAGEESRIEGFDAGADDYLTKPFSARELLARVGALLELDYMRRTGEQAFRRRSAQYETLLQEAPLGVFLVDADFKIREANPTALATIGAISDLIGRDFADLIRSISPQPAADEIIGHFKRTLETGDPYFSSEHVQQRLDRGVTEHYEWQTNRIPLPDGRLGVVCYFRDISAHVHARARLETADRQKDEFLAMLAHELRNPLAPLRNAAEVLSRSTSPDSERTRTVVEIVQRQVTNLSRLVDDLLDVSRITQGRIELKRRSVQLTEVIGQALEIVDPLFRELRHRVLVTGHAPLRVNGDAERLVQCVANVLTNAAKYTDRGGRIEVGLRDDGTEAVITIKDDGAGIAPDLLPHVFDLFVQSTRTLDRSQGGLGIGLSVVKRLVEMHGGRVRAASDGVGRGATFEIRLPALEADDRPAAEVPRPTQAPSRILVVDDNQDAADSLAMMLALDGHEVRQTYAGAPALACLREFRPDVILLDIGLPGMDGYEVARRIREEPDGANIRLIALTGYGQESDKSRTRAAGFDEHLVKPVELRNLHQALAGGAARH
jgi:PAS domain S-box-containing protein